MMTNEISIYIHIPFCVKKCAYCDFASFSGRMAQAEAYVQAVCREMRAQAAFFGARNVRSVFIGGGTPTLLTGAQIDELLDTLRACFMLNDGAEVTMEGNPGTLSLDRLLAYHAAGVNRLSLGVQSMDDGLLASIGRIHTARQAEEAVSLAREAGFENLNLDLMYGLPGQTCAQWTRTLERAIALAPQHLSCYSLIVEEGTPLFDAVQAGTCAPLPDEESLEAMDEATFRLTREAGYERYEVSNYARDGFACLHNRVYWECLPYLGFGLNAHSDMDGKRFYNPADWEAYMRLANGEKALREEEGKNSREERMFERMMMGLRMVRGVDAFRFERDFGRCVQEVWPRTIADMEKNGLMTRGEGRIRLTERGMQVMNGVLVRLLEEGQAREARPDGGSSPRSI